MTDDAAALLRTILDDPTDDVARLVYADYLEEHGQAERAEFIRLQCELSQIHPEDWHWTDARERESELLRRFAREWLKPFEKLVKPEQVRFARGFVEGAIFEASEFTSQSDKLVLYWPLRYVKLRNISPPTFVAFFRMFSLRRLTGLNLDGNDLHTSDLVQLMQCPYLAGLTELSLANNQFDDEAASLLGQCDRWTNLEVLNLAGNPISSAGVQALMASANFPRLRYLGLESPRGLAVRRA